MMGKQAKIRRLSSNSYKCKNVNLIKSIFVALQDNKLPNLINIYLFLINNQMVHLFKHTCWYMSSQKFVTSGNVIGKHLFMGEACRINTHHTVRSVNRSTELFRWCLCLSFFLFYSLWMIPFKNEGKPLEEANHRILEFIKVCNCLQHCRGFCIEKTPPLCDSKFMQFDESLSLISTQFII